MLFSELMTLFIAIAIVLAVLSPIAWKWQLGLSRSILVVSTCGSGIGMLLVEFLPARTRQVTTVLLTVLLTFLASLGMVAFRFYRDPERTPPEVEGAIVSPADGQIIYVYRSEQSLLPISTKQGRKYTLHELTRTSLQDANCIVVGIAMNYLDVHVNRAPIAGKVLLHRHFPGRFGSLRDPAMRFANERATTVIRNADLDVAVVQIASRLVRQIVGYVKAGEPVNLGQRIGVIRLGSQVDLVIPLRPELEMHARVGDHVVAGESVVAMFAGQQVKSTCPECADFCE